MHMHVYMYVHKYKYIYTYQYICTHTYRFSLCIACGSVQLSTSLSSRSCHISTHPHSNATHCNIRARSAPYFYSVASRQSATHCIPLQRTTTQCYTPRYTATLCKTLQHTTKHCNTLQHTCPWRTIFCSVAALIHDVSSFWMSRA